MSRAMIRNAARAGALLVFCAVLPGCGALPRTTVGSGRDRFDGVYEGQRVAVEVSGSGRCRSRPRPVRFVVENGIVEMRLARRAPSRHGADLWGAVSTDGVLTMRPLSGRRMVAGRMEGGRLTAADAEDAETAASAQSGRTRCAYRYQATRAGTGSAPGNGAAPPRDGLPQP